MALKVNYIQRQMRNETEIDQLRFGNGCKIF